MTAPALFSESFLLGRWDAEFQQYVVNDDQQLLDRLKRWSGREIVGEKKIEAAFVTTFFEETWGYSQSGRSQVAGHTCEQQFSIVGAGAGGGTGAADLALGFFGQLGLPRVPQAVCEFKDIRSALDAPQRRQGSTRSPVEQAFDYLREAGRAHRMAAVEPQWAIVTDMNEFRLYTREQPSSYQRFVIERRRIEPVVLTDETPEAQVQRFFFAKLFHRDWLLAQTSGAPPLLDLWRQQGVHERKIENAFYEEYHAYREKVFETIVEKNPGFSGTRGKLVRLTQRFLDRCLFVLFCEDMGTRLQFPQHLLRELLRERANSRFFDPESATIWHEVKDLFRSMRDGTTFGGQTINRFNGGLFAEDSDLDTLVIPNRLFCASGQGDPQRWAADKKTLLFFSATYYYGVESKGEKALSLYALGRIFEQSITDLELMEAKAENRPSITELSKRKRDGVYYTPEWVTYYLVDQTLGARLAELRTEFGLDASAVTNTRRQQLDAYEQALRGIKVLDPACGSGAFLIQALAALVRAHDWIAIERERLGLRVVKGKDSKKVANVGVGTRSLFDQDVLVRDVLSQNIYGVDINSESVEITRLALWLHTALPGRPLTSLDQNIRCGNTLVGEDFYDQKMLFSEERKERINVFDFDKAFPEVFGRSEGRNGFDVVIGNPPYVKLQNLKRVDADVTEYLKDHTVSKGAPLYQSTQTGNYDLYLPFIERSISLLATSGKMGFIAPNVWLKADYGEGLRKKVHRGGHLERWVDFRHHQVFDEAITYTALQFFTGVKNDGIRVVLAPNGQTDIASIDWTVADVIPYAELDAGGMWVVASAQERAILTKLDGRCDTLGKVASIIVGVQTTVNEIYHLKRVAPGRYESEKSQEFAIEDAIMRPLAGAEQARRYEEPRCTWYVLFPYDDTIDGAPLISAKRMEGEFPNAWQYLRGFEARLRAQHLKANPAKPGRLPSASAVKVEDKWWGYAYRKNIDKQGRPKLCVAQTVPEMRVCYDVSGSLVLDNVRVNGILAKDSEYAWYLLGVLNGTVTNFVFKLIGKPKEGGFFEANKQFISPLPIPNPNATEQTAIAAAAQELQRLHTLRRDTAASLVERIVACDVAWHPLNWLWPDVDENKPKRPTAASWNKDSVRKKLVVLTQQLARRAGPLTVRFVGGAVLLEAGGVVLLRAFVSASDAPMALVHWRQALRDLGDDEESNVTKFVERFLCLRDTSNPELIRQIIDLDEQAENQDRQIIKANAEIESRLMPLYALDAAERAVVAASAGK